LNGLCRLSEARELKAEVDLRSKFDMRIACAYPNKYAISVD